jgi:hypothetical protein
VTFQSLFSEPQKGNELSVVNIQWSFHTFEEFNDSPKFTLTEISNATLTIGFNENIFTFDVTVSYSWFT